MPSNLYKDALRAAWAEINITNLDFNIKQIKEKVGSGVKITGVVKAMLTAMDRCASQPFCEPTESNPLQ